MTSGPRTGLQGVTDRTASADDAKTIVELRDVTFHYSPDAPLLQNFNMRIGEGEFLTLLGPSGCGKTTVMNLVAGFTRARHGVILFEGQPLTSINTRVGYMTQGDTLLPWRTVAQNVRLPLDIRKVPRDTIADRVDRGLDLLHLSHARDMYPSELSGGMKRRALLARSIIYDPDMLLMDEPFAALDAQLRETLHRELLSTVSEIGQTVLFITHDISESILLSDRVLVLGSGPARILEDVRIPFGRDREISEVRDSIEFFELERHIRGLMG